MGCRLASSDLTFDDLEGSMRALAKLLWPLVMSSV